MLDYSDKRGRYKGLHPASMPPGTPKFDNPVKRTDVVYSRPAIRGQREAFRHTTLPVPPVPPPEPVKPYVEPVPELEGLGDVSIMHGDENEL